MDKHIMYYKSPAENSVIGWESQSIPLGNGYMGANVFGGTDFERIQMTSNELANPLSEGGLNNFAELYIDFNHIDVSGYVRGLNMDEAYAFCEYNYRGNHFTRQFITSYPDNCLAVKLNCDKNKLNFDLRAVIPYLETSESANNDTTVSSKNNIVRKTGKLSVSNKKIIMRGILPLHGLVFEAQATVETNGRIIEQADKITVKNANFAYIYYTQCTSYKLDSKVFLEQDTTKKAIGEDPHTKVSALLNNASVLGYEKLFIRHTKDYCKLFSRVELNISDKENYVPTDKLLIDFKDDDNDFRIVELYYQFGRYLLISSSRKGTLPSSLQGVWNVHDKSPWGCGYWHNINVQMNYWPAFSTNLAETFEAYADFVKAYLPRAQEIASEYVKKYLPENYVEGQGECGWAIGTGSNAYSINPPESHSGPGTGGLTTKLFWDYYDFTRDVKVLKDTVYPIIQGMSKFLTKTVKNYEGRYLAAWSASPEQMTSKYWNNRLGSNQMYYHTVGCAFDQQLIYENGRDYIKCADLLGIADDSYYTQKEQLNCYDPIHIGYSGQIKEFEEEHFYGEICEANHRHISQLVALMPGTVITSSTPAWMDAAKKTLMYRGDKSTGWALAHRLCSAARTGDGDHAFNLLKILLKTRTYINLWDWHPPFQIDGNFGAIAGITEMLLQSHQGYVSLLPALPSAWAKGNFKGLKARGNFTIDCSWNNGFAKTVTVESVLGGNFKLRYPGVSNVTVKDADGNTVVCEKNNYFISFDTVKDGFYIIENFTNIVTLKRINGLSYNKVGNEITLEWEPSETGVYRVYKSINDEPCYTLVCETVSNEFKDIFDSKNSIQNYRVTVYDGKDIMTESLSESVTVHNASQLEIDRYVHRFRQNNI